MEVLEIRDHGVVPVPEHSGNYIPELMFEADNRPQLGRLRADVKPLEISQREGPSFEVDGHTVDWQRWRFHVGWTPREGLVLFDVRYDDGTSCVRSSTGLRSPTLPFPTAARCPRTCASAPSTRASTGWVC
jgi:Cu2+-containing amine oxidase